LSGFPVNIRTFNNYTPLHLAASAGKIEVMALLISNGALLDGGMDDYINEDDDEQELDHPIHLAAYENQIESIDFLLQNGVSINSRNIVNMTALHCAAKFNHISCIDYLLDKGICISEDIDEYAPYEENDELIDCRFMILAEQEHRYKRIAFDKFINHHIEYQPYINSIYTLCYPRGNIQVAKPPVGWNIAETIRDKYYFDEIFFYLHIHIANYYRTIISKEVIVTQSRTKLIYNNSNCHFANSNNKTYILMYILSDRLKYFLKPQ